jgi:uncharacterized protein (DUF2236 family)
MSALADRMDHFFDTNVRARFFRGLDFAGPVGDPGWFGPDSAVWYVHSHVPAVAFGLFCAAYLEGLDPSIQWMGADHSRITGRRADGTPTGEVDPDGAAIRFAHSLSFFLGTAYGSTETADRLARTVRAMHHTVKGTRPDGLAYDADDPLWLRWNYATVVWGLATAHELYHPRPLRGPALDRYYGEFVRVGHALGGNDLPTTKAETLDCLKAYLPRLAVTAGKAARTGENLRSVQTSFLTGPFMDWAMRDTLPDWAARMVFYRPPSPIRRRARRARLRLMLHGIHKLIDPLPEFRQARARTVNIGSLRPANPSYTPGTDPILTRAEAEALSLAGLSQPPRSRCHAPATWACTVTATTRSPAGAGLPARRRSSGIPPACRCCTTGRRCTRTSRYGRRPATPARCGIVRTRCASLGPCSTCCRRGWSRSSQLTDRGLPVAGGVRLLYE